MVIMAATNAQNVPDNVVELGAELAEKYDDELHVLHVHEEDNESLPLDSGAYTPDDSQGQGDMNQADEATEVALRVANRTLGNNASITPIGRSGDVAEAIIEEASMADARFLVIGGRKRSPAGKALFGSATQEILLSAEMPVVTVMNK